MTKKSEPQETPAPDPLHEALKEDQWKRKTPQNKAARLKAVTNRQRRRGW